MTAPREPGPPPVGAEQQLEVRIPRADDARYQDFLRRAKGFWARNLYREVERLYRDDPRRPSWTDADAVEAGMRDHAAYRCFGWLERHIQRSKYRSPRGIAAIVDAQRERLLAEGDAAAREEIAAGRLRLDPALELPRYYTRVEFHQHPGGVWSDPLAGWMYDLGRNTTMPQSVRADDIHERFAAAVPRLEARRILDVGCGTGRSTLPFAARFPGAELHGIDVSAPCLVRAAVRSRAAGVPVHWSQQLAEATGFADGSFDIVHSTFLLHEMPAGAVERFVREAHRLLRPGGLFVHLDFQDPPGGLFGEFIHFGHGRRNDEPFMRSFCATDFLALERRVGFAHAERRPFDDGSGLYARDEVPPVWRFPSHLFVAER